MSNKKINFKVTPNIKGLAHLKWKNNEKQFVNISIFFVLQFPNAFISAQKLLDFNVKKMQANSKKTFSCIRIAISRLVHMYGTALNVQFILGAFRTINWMF